MQGVFRIVTCLLKGLRDISQGTNLGLMFSIESVFPVRYGVCQGFISVTPKNYKGRPSKFHPANKYSLDSPERRLWDQLDSSSSRPATDTVYGEFAYIL